MTTLTEIQEALYSHKCLETLQEESKQMSCQYLATLITNGSPFEQLEKEVADLDLDASLSAWIKQHYFKPKITPISFDVPSAKVDYTPARVSRKFGQSHQEEPAVKSTTIEKSLKTSAVEKHFESKTRETSSIHSEKSAVPEWNCSSCDFSNYGVRDTCRNCRQQKIENWTCMGCQGVNFPTRTACFKCKLSKGVKSILSQPPANQQPNWPCPSCDATNYPHRQECFKCHFPRPNAGPIRTPKVSHMQSPYARSQGVFKPDIPVFCQYGAQCLDPACTFAHPSPAVAQAAPVKPICRFFPNCMNGASCPFLHPAGASYPTYTPATVACKFQQHCTRPGCPFLHHPVVESKNKVWTAASGHPSERSFAVGDDNVEKVSVHEQVHDTNGNGVNGSGDMGH